MTRTRTSKRYVTPQVGSRYARIYLDAALMICCTRTSQQCSRSSNTSARKDCNGKRLQRQVVERHRECRRLRVQRGNQSNNIAVHSWFMSFHEVPLQASSRIRRQGGTVVEKQREGQRRLKCHLISSINIHLSCEKNTQQELLASGRSRGKGCRVLQMVSTREFLFVLAELIRSLLPIPLES